MKKIIVKGINYEDLNNSMPTPDKYNKKDFGGMEILDKYAKDDLMDCFMEGCPFEIYSACEDSCEIKYGGKATLTYHVDENSMREYGADIQTYIEFIVYLKTKFPKANIKVIGLTKEEKKLLILENLK